MIDLSLWKETKWERKWKELTNHSLCPWNPSWFSLFTAITMPVPGFEAASECSSTHPLNTEPKPPSPNTLSGRKFLVAFLSSLKVKLFKLDDCKISPSLRGVCDWEPEETLLLELLFPFLSAILESSPMAINTIWISDRNLESRN